MWKKHSFKHVSLLMFFLMHTVYRFIKPFDMTYRLNIVQEMFILFPLQLSWNSFVGCIVYHPSEDFSALLGSHCSYGVPYEVHRSEEEMATPPVPHLKSNIGPSYPKRKCHIPTGDFQDIHPWKLTWNLKNHPNWTGNSSSKSPLLGSMWIFRIYISKFQRSCALCDPFFHAARWSFWWVFPTMVPKHFGLIREMGMEGWLAMKKMLSLRDLMDTTPWKFNSSPLKIYHPKRRVVFQPSFFRGDVELWEGTFPETNCLPLKMDDWKLTSPFFSSLMA